MKRIKGAWMLRGKPHGQDRVDQFLDDGFIAIGYPHLGDLSKKSADDIQHLLEENKEYNKAYNTPRKMAMAVSPLNRFVNDIELGDYIIVPDEEDIYLGIVTGDYDYIEELDNDIDGYPHQRKVDFKLHLKRYHLDEDLRNSLRATMTLANLTEHIESVEKLIPKADKLESKNTIESADEQYFEFSYPIDGDGIVSIKIPINIKNDDIDVVLDIIESMKKDD